MQRFPDHAHESNGATAYCIRIFRTPRKPSMKKTLLTCVLAAFVRSESAKWTKVIRDANIKPE